MRGAALMVSLLLAACSRSEAHAAPDRHKTSDRRTRAVAQDTAPVLPEGRPPAHVFALPSGFGDDITPGAQPSRSRARSTRLAPRTCSASRRAPRV
jgi:hypothetical protein